MNIYFAPMEGITGYAFRDEFEKCYGGIDKYYSPFIAPMGSRPLRTKEEKDINPLNNKGIFLVPQILAKVPENFINCTNSLIKLGYKEINLNCGCPSNTVALKGKGSGMLRDTEALDGFLREVFDYYKEAVEKGELKISVKSRIGYESAEEFKAILEIYNKYPLSELIIHPRVKTDFYKGIPDMEAFDYAYKNSRNPLCYNGDVNSLTDYRTIIEKYPKLNAVMLGRGLIKNPGLAYEIKNDEKISTIASVMAFHDRLFERYNEELGNEKDAVFRMKELWFYFGQNIKDQKLVHKLLICKNKEEYRENYQKLKNMLLNQ